MGELANDILVYDSTRLPLSPSGDSGATWRRGISCFCVVRF